MLILTRKLDQGIVISGNILIRVLGVERDRVKIGIQAPREVTILRQELLEREGTCLPGKSDEPAPSNTTEPGGASPDADSDGSSVKTA